MRFYDPISGHLCIDGDDIRTINVHHLRDQIGLVNQEPTLFATSIAGNIAYGCPGVSQEQIEAAARLSNAHDFISSFPQGYNTQVGDKGAQLSGGEYLFVTNRVRQAIWIHIKIWSLSPYDRSKAAYRHRTSSGEKSEDPPTR
jgi:ABC-type transport system involved in Fe-S cluster assembly fused permease/ATPase subunit